ncbi:hypothetical protein vseg_018511 [Gypsophila vaccaria]
MSKKENNNNNNKPMKVVHIKTQYVTTDATSFKSVVQTLTGKDSTIPESPRRSKSSSLSATTTLSVQNSEHNSRVLDRVGGGSFKSCLSRDLSFGRLLKDFPSIDELHTLLNL